MLLRVAPPQPAKAITGAPQVTNSVTLLEGFDSGRSPGRLDLPDGNKVIDDLRVDVEAASAIAGELLHLCKGPPLVWYLQGFAARNRNVQEPLWLRSCSPLDCG